MFGSQQHPLDYQLTSPSAPPPAWPLQVTLEPYERDHAVVVGVYRQQKKKE